ncbi:CENPB DNA-binding domain-containing protein 1 [Portunus trituberculatus]|uniref:CENPB DNA-binding domain-containing protein 1 n=1 Tax=Portunus trituberculatus TaxID=210409 RepID=A0A5B7K4P6_PORTR|nr:CENPB DNA-binding domain-containing protein 1 [Portunus trituberculatus]
MLIHTSRQAFEYTSASCGQNAHHSLPSHSPLLVQNNNSVQQQLVFPRSTCHQYALQPPLQCCLALLRPGKSFTLEVKLDIIHRYEIGEKTNSIARYHGLTPSTVSTIFKSADSIKKAGLTVSSFQAKRTTRTRDSAMDRMESLVEMWYISFVCVQ